MLRAFEDASTSESVAVPNGFLLEGGELRYRAGSEHAQFVCGAIDVVAKARNGDQGDWARVLRWRDDDEFKHEWLMPMGLLYKDKSELLAMLANRGLRINGSKNS